MPKGNPLTDEQRNKIGRLIEAGLANEEIADFFGITDSAVSKIRRVLKFVIEDNFEEAEKVALSTNNKPALEWALKWCGKTLPEKKAEQPKKNSEPQTENCKEMVIRQIDEIQMGRLMVSIGKQNELLETLLETLINHCETQNKWLENVCIQLELITGNQCALKAETKENLGQCVNALTGIQKNGIKWNGGTRR